MDRLDLSQTRRVVFLVDLHPLLLHPDPTPYVSTVLATACHFLSFSPLSSSLFAFKLFFSSLSPLLSASKIHHLLGKSATSFSFDHPSQTLLSLSKTLNSLSSTIDPTDMGPSRASVTVRSLCQILHDYAWEPRIQDPEKGIQTNIDIRPNLFILFSLFPRSLKSLSEFIDYNEDESLLTEDVFCEKFCQILGSVKEGFIRRDIQFGWLDVNLDEQFIRDKSNLGLGFLEKGIKNLGWGNYSSYKIVLGSAVVPFGLIYPYIACSTPYKRSNSSVAGRVELSLEIVDVKGRPLECKCCDLEFMDLKLNRGISANLSSILEHQNSVNEDFDGGKCFWRGGVDCTMKIHVKKVWRNDKEAKIKDENMSDLVLVRSISTEVKTEQKREVFSDFFADKVLEMLRMETSEFTAGKPAWQILLNFLYKRSYLALVLVSNDHGNSAVGILRPFTVHYAILCIFDSMVCYKDLELDFGDNFSALFCKQLCRVDNEVSEAYANFNSSNLSANSRLPDSQYTSGSKPVECRSKRNKKSRSLLQNVTWRSFCKTILSHSSEATPVELCYEIELEAIYFTREYSRSKKLRFLQCWMKQINKWSDSVQVKLNDQKGQTDVEEECSLSVGETTSSGSMTPAPPPLEACEAFLESIPQKIQQILDAKEMDIGSLAKHLVDSSIHWLCLRLELTSAGSLVTEETKEINDAALASEVEKRLFRKPKDLDTKYKGCNSSSLASELSLSGYTSEDKVREHELQILLRMEMLQSRLGVSIKEASKQKMVKEICSLLWNIDPQGGIFGGESLVEFAGRTIQTRYARSLGDVIRKIYMQMDFLLGDEEDEEASVSSIKGDECEEQKAKEENDFVGGCMWISSDKNLSEKTNPVEDDDLRRRLEVKATLHDCKLIEARERRERARRFSSFTSWMPDLQRVWALKQPSAGKVKLDLVRKPLGKSKRRRSHNVVVCETPMAGTKCMYAPRDGNLGNCETMSSHSISKALFQSEDDVTTRSWPDPNSRDGYVPREAVLDEVCVNYEMN